MRRYLHTTLAALVCVGFLVLDERGTAGAARKPPPPAAPLSDAAVVRPRSRKDSIAFEIAKVQSYITLSAKPLDKRIQSALTKIDGAPRRLLALKYYLDRRSVKGIWAWTAGEMTKYRKSVEFRIANAEVDKVISLFQRTYPGYQLRASKLARSLEEQVGLWNKTQTVNTSSTNLMKQVVNTFSRDSYPDTATKQSLGRFQKFLRNQKAKPVPTVAVPGLSHHGQLRAYDFIIWQGDKIVAGTSAGSIRREWGGAGWGEKLRQVVYRASSSFEGPLTSPNEPWHFTYIR